MLQDFEDSGSFGAKDFEETAVMLQDFEDSGSFGVKDFEETAVMLQDFEDSGSFGVKDFEEMASGVMLTHRGGVVISESVLAHAPLRFYCCVAMRR